MNEFCFYYIYRISFYCIHRESHWEKITQLLVVSCKIAILSKIQYD